MSKFLRSFALIIVFISIIISSRTQAEKIKVLRNESTRETSTEIKDTTRFVRKKHGFYFCLNGGAGFMITRTQLSYTVSGSVGYEVLPNFQVGAGAGYIGVEYQENNVSNYSVLNTVPVFLEARYILNKNKASPVFSAELGGILNTTKYGEPYIQGNSRLYADFGAGYLFNLKRSLNVTLTAHITHIGDSMYDPHGYGGHFPVGSVILIKLGIGL